MIRILINIEKSEKQWLMKRAEKENISSAELIRRAIALYRSQNQYSQGKSLNKLLQKTKGTWQHGDGLEHQSKLRNEWE